MALGSLLTLIVIAYVINQGFRQISVTGAYREVSRQLGLQVDHRGTSLQGHLGDRRLWIGAVQVGHGHERKVVHWGAIDLERPLGFGMTLRRRGMSNRIFRRGRNPEVSLGGALDKILEVQAAEQDRVRHLLTPPVISALEELVREWRDVVVTDESVRVHLKKPVAVPNRLMRLVNQMNALAIALDEARTGVSTPEPLEAWIAPWTALAQELDLVLDPALPAIQGDHKGHRVSIFPVYRNGHYEADLQLFFNPHRTVGIRVRPQVEPDGYWSVGQDIQIGHEAFDNAFVIKGYDIRTINELLDAERVRKNLLAILEMAPVTLDDRGLTVRRLPLEPDVLRATLDRGLQVAAGLGW